MGVEPNLLWPGFAALAAGAINALAGGGTLITFPVLLASGVPAIAASITNTVALCPGYIGATLAQGEDLKGQRKRVAWLLPSGLLGGVVGAVLLQVSSDRFFTALVPFLILSASLLLAAQDPLRRRLTRQSGTPGGKIGPRLFGPALLILPAAIYGGYFGAGLSVILLAVLGIFLHDSLTRLNALKQVLALSVNLAAALCFIGSGRVVWPVALVMAIGALIGGALGGKMAHRLPAIILRRIVVSLGFLLTLIYLLR